MTDKIEWIDQAPESGETKQNQIKKTTNDDVIKAMKDIPEETKIRIKDFLEKMWQIQTGKQNWAKKIQEEFCKSDEYIRWSKDIIRKLRNIRYEDYSVWWKYMWIHTYNYDHKIIQYLIPELLNDKKFMLELIKDQPDICRYLWICMSDNREHPLYKLTWKREGMERKLLEWELPVMSDLMKDKDFILKVIPIVRVNCLASLYANIPSNSTIKEDKEIINKMLDAGWDSLSWAGGTILHSLVQKDSPLLDDREIMKKIVVQIWWYNRHKHHPKIKDDDEYLLLTYKSWWAWWFYTFDDDFKRKNPDYYPNLINKAESLIKNNEQELIGNIEENPFKASKFKIDAIIGKIDAKFLNDDVFVLKLLFADKDLYDKINHSPKYLLKHIATYLQQKSDKWSECVCEWTVDIDSKQGVMSYTCWTVKLGNVCEYGNNVIVWYNGKEQKQHVVYRAARDDNSGDNRGLCFTKTKISSIQEQDNTVVIEVEASSKETSRTYRFSFTKTELPKETQSRTPQQQDNLQKSQEEINERVKSFDSSYQSYTDFCANRSRWFREAGMYLSGMQSACIRILDELKKFKEQYPEDVGWFNELDQIRNYIGEKISYLKRNVNPPSDSWWRLFDKRFSEEIIDEILKNKN